MQKNNSFNFNLRLFLKYSLSINYKNCYIKPSKHIMEALKFVLYASLLYTILHSSNGAVQPSKPTKQTKQVKIVINID